MQGRNITICSTLFQLFSSMEVLPVLLNIIGCQWPEIERSELNFYLPQLIPSFLATFISPVAFFLIFVGHV